MEGLISNPLIFLGEQRAERKYLTNFGTILSSNSVYLGALEDPVLHHSFDEPYEAFVNHGVAGNDGRK